MSNADDTAAAEELQALKNVTEGRSAPRDLADMDTSRLGSAACELKDPVTGEPTGQKLWLFSRDHPKVQAYLENRANTDLRLEAQQAARGKTPDAPTVDQGRKRAIELLTVATERWEDVFFKGERNAGFTVGKAQELYAIKFVREQGLEFINELAGFTPG